MNKEIWGKIQYEEPDFCISEELKVDMKEQEELEKERCKRIKAMHAKADEFRLYCHVKDIGETFLADDSSLPESLQLLLREFDEDKQCCIILYVSKTSGKITRWSNDDFF